MSKIQIIFEDESYDRAFEAGELSEADAVTLAGDGKRLISVTAVRAAKDEVDAYLARYESEPFSKEAADFLSNELLPVFGRFGYESDPDSPYVTVAFSPDKGIPAPKKTLPQGVSLVWCEEGEGEKYDFSLIEGGADDGECALAVKDGVVLCAAGINDLCREGYYEIYVECAEGYRRLGLGSACVALLCSRLCEAGRGVRYETTGDNVSSIALARSLGFREIERIVSFSALGKE
jgi:hypothetical protein